MGFLSGQSEYFGLDIGSGSIRLVKVKKGGAKPSLEVYASTPVPDGITASDSPTDVSRVAEVVKKLVKDSKVNTKSVVAGLPSNKVFATVVTMPKVSNAELGKAIHLQADQYIPMAVKDAKIDWFVLGPAADPAKQEVLLVAAPDTVTSKYVSLTQQAGLELIALEPNAVALARAVVQPNSLAVLVLDIGSVSSDITIVHSNMPKLIRSVDIGGTTFVKSVAQNLGLDDAQADQFTRKFGLTQTKLEGQVYKAIKPSLDRLTSEIAKSVKYFNGQYPDVKLEKLILTGGTTGLPELPAVLSTATGLTVEIANAWVNVSYNASMQDELMAASTSFGVAVGLSERDML